MFAGPSAMDLGDENLLPSSSSDLDFLKDADGADDSNGWMDEVRKK